MTFKILKKGLEDLGISEDIPEELYMEFIQEMLAWNEKTNLTRIVEMDEIQIKHLLDSLSLLRLPYFNDSQRIIDLGTGAGFPGIPLKIQRPHVKITLMDSLNKRIQFLDHVIEVLNMEGIEAIHGRAEEISRTEDYRELYDVCVSRAVARLNTLCEYCLPFVKPGGHFIAMKAELAREELDEAQRAIEILGGAFTNMDSFTLPDGGERHLIVIEKVKSTPKKYPRGGGKPRKKPL